MDEPLTAEPAMAGDEYEHEAVPPRARLGFKSFVGMYAGEHCAGTELMIGPLFVASGVSAFDVVVGLLLGNALAVLSWMLITAPIATRARLTLYEQLERICGRDLVTLYNLANGVMFCFLAGAMITVSATAVGVLVDFRMPALDDTWPSGVGWVVAVLAVGSVIAVVAALGYRSVAHFANIAAPWMVLVFVAFGLIGLRAFLDESGQSVGSAAELWALAETAIWTGGGPLAGRVKFGLLHVVFFAWFCNAAMHLGMADLSVLRFARRSWYAVASAAGMYVGHMLAWLSASILYALQLHRDPANTDVLPGPLAWEAAGTAGLLCVAVAGWTTANPTIYRAGLAFQAVLPRASRFRVTLVTGLLATLAGMFPSVAMRLLDFVALYGLVLVPMGAVVFADFWLLPRLGLQPWWAQLRGTRIHGPALIAWLGTLSVAWAVVHFGGMQIYFASLPAWGLALISYVVGSAVLQRRAVVQGAAR